MPYCYGSSLQGGQKDQELRPMYKKLQARKLVFCGLDLFCKGPDSKPFGFTVCLNDRNSVVQHNRCQRLYGMNGHDCVPKPCLQRQA